ncbi:MAG: aspartate--tRNA ligase [Candidatus Nanoarchaeia archaeon]
MLRTHTCAELRATDVDQTVTLAGWVHSIRTHGALTFIDIRDRYGRTQLTIENLNQEIGKEFVISATGIVVKKDQPNKELATGEIEVKVEKLTILNTSKALPIDEHATDETKLQYRYIDIRNNNVLQHLAFRSKVSHATREFFEQNEFLEIETPYLMKSTPEGARDYVVPSRVNPNEFYALPQSPQLYKQILMIAGVDKYYQLARALRDEDLRADRQPEHTQIDFEMSFVHQSDVQEFTEKLLKHIFKKTMNIELDNFPVFSYDEAMSRFGSDKPDIRFGLELSNITTIAKTTEFKVFNSADMVNAIFIEEKLSRKQIDKYTDFVKIYKAKGLAYAQVINNKLDAGISKFLDSTTQEKIIKAVGCSDKEGTLLFVADSEKISQSALGFLRKKLSEDFNLTNSDDFKFCWVNDFPLFSYNEDEQRWEPEHHMFSMPKEEFIDDFEQRPQETKGDLWDLVLNGWEMASGSIRVSNPKIQERIMNFVGFDKEEAQKRFGFLLHAYEYGGPIHGGMGIGLDRLVTLMLKLSDIREVIAFPKNKHAQCPMDGSPSRISQEQLDELNISLKK